ncbi:MAG: lipoprotein [Acholeplasmataceae bacterium]|nr:lipoprotein [Acholeplasmataceae bacterium]
MKKISLIIFFVLVLALSSCSSQNTEDILDDLLLHSNFEYQLNSIVTDEIKAEFSEFPGFGMYILVDSRIDIFEDDINVFMEENPTTYYDVSGYPNCLDEYVITRIYTSDPAISVYDYSVGDSYDEESTIAFMDTIGFIKSDKSRFTFENGDVYIRLYYDDENMIYQIVVGLVSRCNVIF